MKNRIAILIEEKYGDMRSSEKQAADKEGGDSAWI